MSYNSVLVKSPLRISFFGGGTDFEYFYNKYGSYILSCAIDKFIYVIVKKGSFFYPDKFRINYSSIEKVNNINLISNNIVRETLKFFKIKESLNITIINDIPAGSGLGSSSSFCLALVMAINRLYNFKLTKNQILKISKKIEITKLKSPIGIQDYLPSLYGGFNFFKIKSTNQIYRKKISFEFEKKVFQSICLVWTGSFRDANEILKDQSRKDNNNNFELNEILKLSKNMFKDLSNQNIDIKKFGEKLLESWNLKKKLSKKIFTTKLLKFEKQFSNISNIYGYKLLGAGGDGFYLIVCDKKSIKKLIEIFGVNKVLLVRNYSQSAKAIYLNK